jgi:LuxR family quorum-sensing system transcriptional regulator CciR
VRVRRLSDRFAEAARSCASLDDLRALLRSVVPELGFDYFALVDHSSLAGPSGAFVRLDNYPQAWVEEFLVAGLAADDPVHLASRRSNNGFGWRELDALIRLERRHSDILERSRAHGLGPGFTVPANVPGEPSASCSFVVAAGTPLPAQSLGCAELVGAHALAAARRLRPGGSRPQPPHLSRRELDCLRLVALGKTDWEIARILGLSTETVRQYVKRARAAYDAVSRAQLIAFALRDSWISFEETIPPSGGISERR